MAVVAAAVAVAVAVAVVAAAAAAAAAAVAVAVAVAVDIVGVAAAVDIVVVLSGTPPEGASFASRADIAPQAAVVVDLSFLASRGHGLVPVESVVQLQQAAPAKVVD